MSDPYQTLHALLQAQPDKYTLAATNEPLITLEKCMQSILTDTATEQTYAKLAAYLSESRLCRVLTFEEVQFLDCPQRKAYTFSPQCKAYCLVGKAVSVYRNTKKEIDPLLQELQTNVEVVCFRLFNQGLLPANKGEEIDDILLHYDLPEEYLPVLNTHQVFSPFIPLTPSIILLTRPKIYRPDQLIIFLRSTLLHVYLEHHPIVAKIATREVFYKNSTFRGIYFIQEGEVQVNSGRVVARGWVTNGKCKSSTFGWKFKLFPFLKFIARNEYVWKQFTSDIKLNKQYPFRLSYLLNIDLEQEIQESSSSKGKKIRLPKLFHSSFNMQKLLQIEKLRHYNEQINNMCEYKARFMLKRLGGSLHRSFEQIVPPEEDRHEMKKRLLKEKKASTQHLNASHDFKREPSNENILIMSVLRRLEGLSEYCPAKEEPVQRRNNKIAPMVIHEKNKVGRSKRYNVI